MKQQQNTTILLSSLLKQGTLPRFSSPQKSKPTSSYLNKSLQNSPTRRDPVTWGITSPESTFQTSYKSHYKHQNSFDLSAKLFTDSDSPTNTQLSGSLIPNETPRFTPVKRHDSRNLSSDLEASESPRCGVRQYSSIKHKPDYTKDDSPESYKLYNSEHSPRRYSPRNPASILKRIHLHHSQVSENFMSVPPESSDYDDHVQLYSNTFDELNTAGGSDLKKRMSPLMKRKRLLNSPREEKDFVNVFRHSYASVDSQHHTHKELGFNKKPTFETIGLRKQKSEDKYTRGFYLGRSMTVNPVRRQDSINSSPDDQVNESVDNRYSTNKSFSGRFTDNGASFDQSKVKQIEKGLSLILNSFCADKSLICKTEPDMDVKTEKSFRTISKSTQSGSKTPVRNLTSRKTVESIEKIAVKEVRKPVKSKTVISETVKNLSVKTGLLNGKIRQGAFSGVNKKYIA